MNRKGRRRFIKTEIDEVLRARFLASFAVCTGEGCWLWMGDVNKGGYGVVSVKGHGRRTRMFAHRVSWQIHHGKSIPDGLFCCHTCDTPGCVRPDHLFLGTPKENSHDSIRKGRWVNPPKMVNEENWNAKLTAAKVREIRLAPGQHKEVAAKFGISPSQASVIRHRKFWRDLPEEPGEGKWRSLSGAEKWGSPGEKNPKAKLTEVEVRAMRKARGTHAEVGERFGVSPAQAWGIRTGRYWRHIL